MERQGGGVSGFHSETGCGQPASFGIQAGEVDSLAESIGMAAEVGRVGVGPDINEPGLGSGQNGQSQAGCQKEGDFL